MYGKVFQVRDCIHCWSNAQLGSQLFHAHTCLQANGSALDHGLFREAASISMAVRRHIYKHPPRALNQTGLLLVAVLGTDGAARTGVRKDSATKRALAFNWPVLARARRHVSRLPYKELHFRDLLVDLFHELNDEVDQLVLQHLLGVEVGDEERDVVALDRLPPQNVE